MKDGNIKFFIVASTENYLAVCKYLCLPSNQVFHCDSLEKAQKDSKYNQDAGLEAMIVLPNQELIKKAKINAQILDLKAKQEANSYRIAELKEELNNPQKL